MRFYLPEFKIASLRPPQRTFRSKVGGLPWGLAQEQWRRCQECWRLMSLLAQLRHHPPALDLGGGGHVLHLFQCQECFGYEAGQGNDAVMVPLRSLGQGLTQLPPSEDLRGILGGELDRLVGELWIEGYKTEDDDLKAMLGKQLFTQHKLSAF